jgi:glutathione S-transferase
VGASAAADDFGLRRRDSRYASPDRGQPLYEDQRKEARRRAAVFLKERLPKFMGYFERVAANNPSGKTYMVGAKPSTVDLSMFQVVSGLQYAFPKAMRRAARAYPRLMALHARIEHRPRIAAYLASARRIAFNDEGIFRHYPELDLGRGR